MDSPLRVQQTGRRLTLTLDDAHRQNALSVEMIESIDHALEGAPTTLLRLSSRERTASSAPALI